MQDQRVGETEPEGRAAFGVGVETVPAAGDGGGARLAGRPGLSREGFGVLRAIQESCIGPGEGFEAHMHRDVEILTFVVEGELEHRDSLGDDVILKQGDVQRLSAGTGVLQAEYNYSAQEPVRFVQAWVVPVSTALPPCCQMRHFPDDERSGRLRLVAARDGREGAVTVHGDLDTYSAVLDASATLDYAPAAGRMAWLQVLRGEIKANGHRHAASEGCAVPAGSRLQVEAVSDAELLLFVVPTA